MLRERIGQKIHVLVADDDFITRMAHAKMLLDLGCVITLAMDGEEALSLAQANRFDLILLDMQMPKLNGIELALAVRQIERLSNILLICATSELMIENTAKAAGINEVIMKPLSKLSLIKAINSYASCK